MLHQLCSGMSAALLAASPPLMTPRYRLNKASLNGNTHEMKVSVDQLTKCCDQRLAGS